jgi:hypothetical protein
MSADDGFWLFLAVTWLRVSSLLIDFALLKKGYPTITSFARRNEWFEWVIMAVEVLGLVGLEYHLRNRGGQGK